MSEITLRPGQRVVLASSIDARNYEVLATVTAAGSAGGAGLPFMGRVVMAIKNTDKAWYEATRRYGPYDSHPAYCEDWNLESGGNTDLGEPLVAPFTGLVLAAGQYGGGIGKVIQLLGLMREGELWVWAGRHLQDVSVVRGQVVTVGEDIGTVGNAEGKYAGAHLHEQVCLVNNTGLPGPTTYASDRRYDWWQPSRWYKNMGVAAEVVDRMAEWDGA